MANELERQLLALKQGDHVCAIYETVAERQAVVVPFIQQGLARGDRCLYIADDDATRELAHALASAGVEVSGEQQRGTLRLLSKRDLYLRFDEFTPQAMVDFLRGQESEAKAESRSGLRVVGEMTCALGLSTNTTMRYCRRWSKE